MELTAADIEDDLDIVDFTQTVTVLRCNPATGATTATVNNVTGFRAEYRKDAVPVGDGGVWAATAQWVLKAADLSGTPPKAHDKITDAGGLTWVVESVTVATLGTRYVCETVQLRS